MPSVKSRVVKKTKKTVSVNLIHHPDVNSYSEAMAIEALLSLSIPLAHTTLSCGSNESCASCCSC